MRSPRAHGVLSFQHGSSLFPGHLDMFDADAGYSRATEALLVLAALDCLSYED